MGCDDQAVSACAVQHGRSTVNLHRRRATKRYSFFVVRGCETFWNLQKNDGSVWSLARQNIGLSPDENLGGVPLPYIVIGGEAFPLKRYLMRPYPRSARRLSEAQRIFNYRLSRSKNTVENALASLLILGGYISAHLNAVSNFVIN